MIDWLVVAADYDLAGRGVRGHTLAWFLQEYVGRRAVRICTSSELASADRLPAKRCLIGLPSALSVETIERLPTLTGAEIAVFDYLDQHQPAWTNEQEVALRRLTNVYLKPWYETAWNYDLRMGLLPIRRYGRLTLALRISRALSRVGLKGQREHDVAFLGRPNQTRFFDKGRVHLVDQRTEWIRSIKREAPELRFWGGLVEADESNRCALETRFGDVSDLLFQRNKASFATYFRALRRSRVVLAPGGNVPWSYRHYECLYSGAAVVTIDYRRRDMLAPLPRENMVHVADGASVVPAVYEALEMFRSRPRLGQENFDWLEAYLRLGAYARAKRPLFDRFVAQFDARRAAN